LDGFEGQSIVVRPAGLLSGPRLLVNGQAAPKGRRRGEALLRRNDGREAVARWKSQFMGLDLPQLVVDGETVPVAQPLKWYQWAWSALPVLLVLGGAGYLVYRNGVTPKLVLWLVEANWDRTSDLQARLEGDASILGFPVSGAGTVRFMRPDLYDLDFTTARVIAGKEALWVIVPAFKAGVRVTAKGMTPAQAIGTIISGWDGANPEAWVRQASASAPDVTLYRPEELDGERCWVLEWPARTGERIGGRLYVSQRTCTPVRFDQMDSGGQITHTYRLKDLRRNTGLQPADFDYKPMAGYHVFEYAYDANSPLDLDSLLRGVGAGSLSGLVDPNKLPADAADWLRRHGVQ